VVRQSEQIGGCTGDGSYAPLSMISPRLSSSASSEDGVSSFPIDGSSYATIARVARIDPDRRRAYPIDVYRQRARCAEPEKLPDQAGIVLKPCQRESVGQGGIAGNNGRGRTIPHWRGCVLRKTAR